VSFINLEINYERPSVICLVNFQRCADARLDSALNPAMRERSMFSGKMDATFGLEEDIITNPFYESNMNKGKL
jgi:hypothetical protein